MFALVYVNVLTSLWRYNNKFTRCTKTLLNLYTWQFLKICTIPNPHINHLKIFLNYFTVKPPNSGHPKERTCLEWLEKLLVPKVKIFFKLPPKSGDLSKADNFLKSHRCPLFRGFTVFWKWWKLPNFTIQRFNLSFL